MNIIKKFNPESFPNTAQALFIPTTEDPGHHLNPFWNYTSMEWYVIYTKPRWEKRVAGDLQKIDIEAYCPMITEVRQWSDRKKKVTTPLFKSYVFVRLSAKDRERVFEVPGVVQYLFWLKQPAIVRDSEIETIKQWLDNDQVEIIDTAQFIPGERITINNGNFKGEEAIIKKVGKKRLKLILQSMGWVVNVKVSEVLE